MTDPFEPKIPSLKPWSPSHDLAKLASAKREYDEEMSGRTDARLVYQHLSSRIQRFQQTLEEQEEMGLQLANFGIASTIHIRGLGFKNPCLIEFYGLDADGNQVQLVQHISQLNFLLIAMKPLPEETPFRMGF